MIHMNWFLNAAHLLAVTSWGLSICLLLCDARSLSRSSCRLFGLLDLVTVVADRCLRSSDHDKQPPAAEAITNNKPLPPQFILEY